MSKVKASRKSAVTQPKSNPIQVPQAVTDLLLQSNHVGLAFHNNQWIKQKAKEKDSDPTLLVNLILNEARERESKRCVPPFNPNECVLVAEWKGYDKTWEQLLYADRARTFYMDWSYAEPCDVTIAEALHWYGQKRALECDYGDLDCDSLNFLIQEAVSALQQAGDPKREPLPTLEDLEAAKMELAGKAGAR